MESMLENRPWLILNVPLIIRMWSPLVNVSKEDLKNVPSWVKLYDVPMKIFMEDGLSSIATKLVSHRLRVVQTTTATKTDNRHARHKDTNSNKVTNNNDYGLIMVDVASANGMKVVTSNPFDVLNMVERDIGVAPHDSVNTTNDDVNVENIKITKGTDCSKSGGETRKKSLYERWKDDYDDNPYDSVEEREDLTEDELAFCVAFDISLRGQIKR
ncbi:copia-type polyprotein [Tanacetum coccineum]